MTAAEWLTICKKVEARWGQSRRWDQAGDLALDKTVTALGAEWAEKAIDDLVNTDEHAPAPAKVLRLGHELQAATRRLDSGLENPLECAHPQPWGFDIIDGKRIAFCRYCYSEWEAPNIKSMSELTDIKETRNIPT
jgi:hypothetical protein